MNITESTRGLVLQGLRTKKQTRNWLAEKIGVHKSWVTRFFSGELKSLTDPQVEALQDALDIRFFSLDVKGQHSTAALDIATEFDRNQAFAHLVQSMQTAMQKVTFTPRYIPTAEMGKVGSEIIRIALENKEKPGKVARLVLELLA
jgi:hypothetical protein